MLWSIWSKKYLLYFSYKWKKIAKTITMIPKIFKNLMIQVMMWPLMEFFSKNNQNNHVSSNKSYDFLGICDPPDVEPDDISEANSKSYFAIGVV